MTESRYLSRFMKLQENCKDVFCLTGGRILLEEIAEPELKTAGGLIIPTVDRYKETAHDNKAKLGIVLLVGEGYEDEDGNAIEPDIKQGEIVLMPSNGVYYNTWPGLAGTTDKKLCVVRDSDIMLRFNSIEDFTKCSQVLNG